MACLSARPPERERGLCVPSASSLATPTLVAMGLLHNYRLEAWWYEVIVLWPTFGLLTPLQPVPPFLCASCDSVKVGLSLRLSHVKAQREWKHLCWSWYYITIQRNNNKTTTTKGIMNFMEFWWEGEDMSKEQHNSIWCKSKYRGRSWNCICFSMIVPGI